ncbi:carboxypeptidase-like regulatory domain-containing protein [Streptomyces sp. NPDC055089]
MDNVWGGGKLDNLVSDTVAPRNAVHVTGRITEKATGAGLSSITVKAAGADGDHKVTTGPDGAYKVALVPGAYDFTVDEYGHGAETLSGLVVTTDSALTRDLALTALATAGR